jgi:PAS domain S-box-containing protein
MRPFRNLPIKSKLTIIVMLTSGVALFLALAVFTASERVSYRRALAEDLSVLADMFGDNAASGLTFQEPTSIEKALGSLNSRSNIMAAAVYDKNGVRVASYQRTGLRDFSFPKAQKDQSLFTERQLDTFRQIRLDGEFLGTIYIGSDLRQVANRFRESALVGGLVLLVSSLVAFIFAARLQQIISGPVSHLASVASQVASERNYALRATKESDDELGRLIDSFNSMLGEIQNRDSALREARDKLEERVQERTQELCNEVFERRRTEEERDRFFTVSLDMLCIASLDGRFKRINPAFQKLLGFSEKEILAKPFVEIVQKDHRAAAEAEVANIVHGNPVANLEVRCACQDGSYRWIAWAAIPVLEEGLFYAYGRDITDRKRAELELEEVHKQLMDTSRRAGMAEVATGVLHNVGNVLNSVNVSATLITDQLKKSRGRDLSRVVGLLREHSHDIAHFLTSDPKGQKVVAFLEQLSIRLEEEQH